MVMLLRHFGSSWIIFVNVFVAIAVAMVILLWNFYPQPRLSPGIGPWYPLYRRLGGPQSRSGHRGYWKKPFPFCRGSNLDRPFVHPITRHSGKEY
jgi:hypothetical protein